MVRRGGRLASDCQSPQQGPDAQDVDHPLQVVSQHVQAHLRTHVGERAGQEVRRAHPVLNRPEDVLDRMQDRLERMPEAMLIRRQTVEHPFGTIKAWMGSTHFLMKTLEKVKTEMSLHVLAYNLKRMINILGVGPLLKALAT